MPWDAYDAENLHFHMTIAENCGEKFEQAWEIACESQREFETSFDNIVLLEQVGVVDGIDMWKVSDSWFFNSSPPLA